MSSTPNQIEEEKISLVGVINNFKAWFWAMLMAWKKILIGTLLFGGLFLTYHTLKKVNYTAETTFVLQSGSGDGLGQLSSLASLAGVNVGGLTENSTLFQLDNIVELYRSYSILRKTLLTDIESDTGQERLVTWLGRESKLLEGWNNVNLSFEIPDEQIVVRHDSVLKEVVEVVLEKHLQVGKPSRKLSILRVGYVSQNESLAKTFNEVLVSHVNDFYTASKTKKTGENLRVLSYQADSVKRVVDRVLEELAQFDERNANLNKLMVSAKVPRQKLQIDLSAASVVYQEIVKNLEIAKVAHRNNTPLIQIIDQPILPLKDDKWKWYKALVIGLVLGGIFMVGFLTVRRIYHGIMLDAA